MVDWAAQHREATLLQRAGQPPAGLRVSHLQHVSTCEVKNWSRHGAAWVVVTNAEIQAVVSSRQHSEEAGRGTHHHLTDSSPGPGTSCTSLQEWSGLALCTEQPCQHRLPRTCNETRRTDGKTLGEPHWGLGKHQARFSSTPSDTVTPSAKLVCY